MRYQRGRGKVDDENANSDGDPSKVPFFLAQQTVQILVRLLLDWEISQYVAENFYTHV